jgi:hypothetical protein
LTLPAAVCLGFEVLVHQLPELLHELDLHMVVGEEVVGHLVVAGLVAQHCVCDGVGQVG